MFPFVDAGRFQVSLNAGDEVIISERGYGWYKGTVLASDTRGIFPESYVRLIQHDGEPVEELRARAMW